MNETVLTFEKARQVSSPKRQVSLGRHLIESGIITPWQLFYAFERQKKWDATLSEILLARGWVTNSQMQQALATFYTALLVDLLREPPDPDLAHVLPPEICLKYNVMPWQTVGGLLIVVTGRPDRFEALRPTLPPVLRAALVAIACEDAVTKHIALSHRRPLTRLAESRVDQEFSCRGWDKPSPFLVSLLLLSLLVVVMAAIAAPTWLLAVLTFWAVASLLAVSSMKTGAFLAHLFGSQLNAPVQPENTLLPRISVMVPLYKEREIARALVVRLAKLTYPKALLDVLLVLEEHDDLTHETIKRSTLPHWMRVVEVPAGSGLTTKPRALNYALDHCKADIIGIWDAEDAPSPGQLEVVAAQFAQAPPEVVCLQGVLDYYNPWTNWLSRCFAIEYATWFRVVLPGLAKLGLAIPLGGTTLFMRREAVEKLGGWDAHNVTEDADLGIRLARFGYRTELMPTVTQEEANCRPIAWIKQRSRWLKGYMATYLVHMQQPVKLWREIGFKGFLGVQLVFFCTLSQFLLAPVIWAFWGGFFGLPYLENPIFSQETMAYVALIFLFIGFINALISLSSVWGQNRKGLFPFILTMPFYFSLASFAGYKALFELLFRPYYWDKTAHGKTKEGTDAHHSGTGVLFEPGDKSL